jgi:hypothetical protein
VLGHYFFVVLGLADHLLVSPLPGKQIQVLSGHLQWVYCCSISPDCSMLCSAAGEKSVGFGHSAISYRFCLLRHGGWMCGGGGSGGGWGALSMNIRKLKSTCQ